MLCLSNRKTTAPKRFCKYTQRMLACRIRRAVLDTTCSFPFRRFNRPLRRSISQKQGMPRHHNQVRSAHLRPTALHEARTLWGEEEVGKPINVGVKKTGQTNNLAIESAASALANYGLNFPLHDDKQKFYSTALKKSAIGF